MNFLKPVFVPNVKQLGKLLQGHPVHTTPCLYADRIVIQESRFDFSKCSNRELEMKMKSIRIWKTRSFMDWWYDQQSSQSFIGALDYVVEKDHIKCEYMSVNDGELGYSMNYKSTLTEEEIPEVVHSMVCYLTTVARQENKPKIVVDVHKNLRIYQKHYEMEGFVLTDRKCQDNRAWIEAELSLQDDDYCMK